MNANQSNSTASDFASRVKNATTVDRHAAAAKESKIALFPSAVAPDYQAYVCQRQGMPGAQMMLRFHAKNGVDSYAIEYAHQQSIRFARGANYTKMSLEYYSGEEVVIEGHNLEELYIALSEHRVVWCHAIDEFTAKGLGFDDPASDHFYERKPLIYGITIRRGEEEPLVLASNDPFRMAADQPRSTMAN